ncbi:hypothetical protein [Buttiauxella gaviniae]|uniref:hypothetical protein n=1 Tax=Buttiauxella gaviniae TaxID=82990 RepID=UPI003C74BC56
MNYILSEININFICFALSISLIGMTGLYLFKRHLADNIGKTYEMEMNRLFKQNKDYGSLLFSDGGYQYSMKVNIRTLFMLQDAINKLLAQKDQRNELSPVIEEMIYGYLSNRNIIIQTYRKSIQYANIPTMVKLSDLIISMIENRGADNDALIKKYAVDNIGMTAWGRLHDELLSVNI